MRLCERGARLKEQIKKSGEGMERAIVFLLFAQRPGESFVLSTLGDKLNETAILGDKS